MIRAARPEDAAALAAIYARYVETTHISFEEVAPSPEAMRAKMAGGMKTYPWLVHERDGEVRGYCYGSAHRERPAYRWSVETTIYVAEDARGGGVGKALYGELLAMLRRQGFRSAFAGIALPNPASVALHESCGFKHFGVFEAVGFKLGAWRDVGWWRLGLNETDAPLPEPSSIQD